MPRSEAPHSKKYPKKEKTMRDGKDISVKFIEEAIKTANHIGYKKTIDVMVSLRKVNPDKIFTDSVEIIVNEVMINFKMTKAALLANKPESRQARSFCYVLLKTKLRVDAPFLSSYFKRQKPTIYLDIRLFNMLDKNNKIDSHVLARYETIEKNIDKKLSN